jgi:hypothetical protein
VLTTEKILEQPAAGSQSGSGIWEKLTGTAFFLKLTNWEYWPMSVANFPLVLIWAWFALRARRLFFFSAVNPVIETGGMWGESKFNILKRIPSSHVPPTVFVKQGTDFQEILTKMEDIGLTYPVIAKPNVGERGLLVSKIKNEAELQAYVSKNTIDFLIQKFVDLPLELAVMHHRFPGREQGKVTSICIKETLKVTGDGQSTVADLMKNYPRASLQLDRFRAESPAVLTKIPAEGETLELEPIGNHCRGTMFLNGNRHIDEALTAEFDKVASQMEGIHYGRFDLKCRSVEDLRNGGGFMVMEYNGIGAEPAHIYDPAYPIWKKYREIYRHWRIIYRIYRVQARKGERSMTLTEVIERLKIYSTYKKSLNA